MSSSEENPALRTTEEKVVEEAASKETPPEDIVPKTIHEGATVMCKGDKQQVFRWIDGELRHYLDPGSAAAWDNPKWRKHVMFVNCVGMRLGRSIRTEGQAILCKQGIDDTMFRFNMTAFFILMAIPR